MSGTESPAGNSIDEIEVEAAIAASIWAENHLAAELVEDDAAVSGLVTASAIYYLAERLVHACELVANAIQASRVGGE